MMEAQVKPSSIARGESQLSESSGCVSSLRKIVVGLLILCIILLAAVSVQFYMIIKLQNDFSTFQERTNCHPSGFPSPSSEPKTDPLKMGTTVKKTVVRSRPTQPPRITHSKILGLAATIATKYFTKSSKGCVCQGARGPIGPPGLPGRNGKKGETGERGDRGYDGREGREGQRGIKGDRGIPGRRGVRGPPGKKGPSGPPGPQGSKGEEGTPGRKGEKGEKGGTTITIKEKPRPFAHITGTVSRTKSGRPKGIIRDKWRDYGLFGLKGNGFAFSNGELIVPEDGLYYVYSQFYFHHTDERKDPNMVHFMYKESGSGGETILTSIVTRGKKIENKAILFNSYTGGLHKCKKGDKLMVGVSDELKSMVMYVETHTYFGAYLVERYTV